MELKVCMVTKKARRLHQDLPLLQLQEYRPSAVLMLASTQEIELNKRSLRMLEVGKSVQECADNDQDADTGPGTTRMLVLTPGDASPWRMSITEFRMIMPSQEQRSAIDSDDLLFNINL